MIRLNDALTIMEDRSRKGHVFSLSFVTLDRRKGTGGKLKHIEKASKVGLPYSVKDNSMRGILDTQHPKHPIPVHIRLITEFNGQNVIY